MAAGVPVVPDFSCEQASTEACSRQVLGWYVKPIVVPPLSVCRALLLACSYLTSQRADCQLHSRFSSRFFYGAT
jgi:hypothetical protein